MEVWILQFRLLITYTTQAKGNVLNEGEYVLAIISLAWLFTSLLIVLWLLCSAKAPDAMAPLLINGSQEVWDGCVSSRLVEGF